MKHRDKQPSFSTAETSQQKKGRAEKGKRRLPRMFPSYCPLPFRAKPHPASLALQPWDGRAAAHLD